CKWSTAQTESLCLQSQTLAACSNRSMACDAAKCCGLSSSLEGGRSMRQPNRKGRERRQRPGPTGFKLSQYDTAAVMHPQRASASPRRPETAEAVSVAMVQIVVISSILACSKRHLDGLRASGMLFLPNANIGTHSLRWPRSAIEAWIDASGV